MSKGLIDLKRANTPPENPLTKPEAQTPPISEVPELPAANVNEPAAPAVTAVVTSPQVVTASQTERVSTIGARIPESLHQSIKLFCIANRLEMQMFVQDALTNHLASLQGKTTTQP